MIRIFQPVVLTITTSTSPSILTWPSSSSSHCMFDPGGEMGQCGWLSISLPKVSKLSLVAVRAFTITTKKKSCPSTSSPSQWVLEEKWVSVDGFLSACPKYLIYLIFGRSQCYQQPCSCSSFCPADARKKEDFRRVPRWKIGHGGQCKAENGLRHSALSVSELCVNSLVWQAKL